MITVAIIDDHAVVRMGMKYVIGMDAELAFAGEYAGGVGAADWVIKTKPDVLLLDIYMPQRNGLEVLRELRLRAPAQKVLMLTTSAADNDAYEALRLGACGYLMKDRDANDIFRAIKLVAGGAKYVPDTVKALLRQRELTPNLTARELQVLDKLVEGLSNEGIAEVLGISLSGVKAHLKSIFAKLDVSDRVGAVTTALSRGFVKPRK